MQALVVVGHGSHRNPDSSAPTFAHADRIRATGAFDEVREAFWKEEPAIGEVLRTLESEVVYVVPLFVSEGYFTEQVIPRELRIELEWPGSFSALDGPALSATPTDVEKEVYYCRPVGTHDAMGDVVVSRAESVTGDSTVGSGYSLVVVGHGTERNENSARAIRYHANRIRETGRFDEVRALFMDESPTIDDLDAHVGSPDVVVVPFFVSDGLHTQEDIPEALGISVGGRDGYDVPSEVDGNRIWYAGAVGTEPLVADVLLDRATEAGAGVGTTSVTDEREDVPGD